jgi:putative copper resistance protein D
MLDILLAASRWLHYACLTILFGVRLFPLYARQGPDPPPAFWRQRMGQASVPALIGAVASGVLWFLLVAAGMSADLNAAIDPSALWTALTQTPFGPLWAARFALAVLILTLLARPIGPRWRLAPALLCGVLLASLALTGHAQSEDGIWRLAHETADALHLLAAGAWIGGLVMLTVVLRQAGPDARVDVAPVLARFSIMGYVAVAVLMLSGLVNSLFLLSEPASLIATRYGRLLCLKLALFVSMLALAAVNRLWITPALAKGAPDGAVWRLRLKRQVLAEQVLAVLVLGVVAVLGDMDPAAS